MNSENKTSLVVLAAGFGTRFQSGIKQLTPVGPKGELLMEYSIRDAVTAGFDKVIFVIRRDIESRFRELIGKKAEQLTDVSYCFQDGKILPEGFTAPYDRKKPWGTVHAVLAASGLINEPFAIINADDYYGIGAYKLIHEFLADPSRADSDQCMVGYVLKNTLSPTGPVTRGVCVTDKDSCLDAVHETYHIVAEKDGMIYGEQNGSRIAVDGNSIVSMNMWGFDPSVMSMLDESFSDFLKENISDSSAEYPLPMAVDNLIRQSKFKVKVIPTDEKWFGMTYAEDIDEVKKKILLRGEAYV